MNIDNLQKIVDEIKKTNKNLNNTFNKTYDNVYPYIRDYKEKIRKLNDKSFQLQTMKNEQEFIDYYNSYTELKNKEKKILEYLSSIKRQVESYKEILKEFHSGTNRILEKIKEDYNIIINLQFHEDMEQLGKSSFFRVTIDRTLGSVTTKHLKGNGINLINILHPDKKSRLIENEKKNFISKKKSSRNNEVSKLNDEASNSDSPKLNLIFGIEPNTRNIFIFDKIKKNITKMNLNFDGLSIDKFVICLSSLNYMGRFYISGGVQNPKNFFRLNIGNKSLKQLMNMPTRHNYHGMIGIGNNIYSVSGFKNPNVESYDISSNSWSQLQPLESSFSWPGCLSIEDRFLYVFGGLCETNKSNKRIYKIDVMRPGDKWNAIDINTNIDSIPFYSGFVLISPNQAIVLGGKNNTKHNNLDKCFKFDFGNNSFNDDNEYNLPNREVFNGKRFCDLGGGLFGEFSCVSYNKFYLVNTSSKTINYIE